MIRRMTSAGAFGIALAVTSCTSTTPESAQSASTNSPHPAGTATNSAGLPVVTFDPCTDIDDGTLRQFALDPSTKWRNETTVSGEDIVACNVKSNHHVVGFIAQNTPWDKIPLSEPAQPMTINDREALYAPDALTEDSCALLMRTDFGAFIIDTFPRRGGTYGAGPEVGACDGIVDMAEAVEPLIKDGN